MIIAILTPIPVEHAAILSQLEVVEKKIVDGSRYIVGQFEGLYHSFTVVTQLSGAKNETTALAVEKVIQHFKPVIILLAGVGGGIKDVEIGDVVVGTKYYGYEFGKVTKEGFASRPESGYYSNELVTLARAVAEKNTWRQRVTTTISSHVVFGAIASGNKVITATDSDTYRLIKKNYNDAIVIEMEAVGLGQAMRPYPAIRFLNVRGISDLLDGKSLSDANGSQKWAAKNMAAFVYELLYQLEISHFKILGSMDIKALSKRIIELILPAIKSETPSPENGSKNEVSASIQKLHNKVEPFFSEEYTELQKWPEDNDAQTAAWMKLKRVFEKEEGLLKEIVPLLKKAQEEPGGINSNFEYKKNILKNSNISVGGDFHLGDR